MRISNQIFGFLCLLLFAGCTPSIGQITSSYIAGVREFLRDSNNGKTDFSQSLEVVDNALIAEPDDQPLNLLRTRILLNKYRFSKEGADRLSLITQFQITHSLILSEPQKYDWVEPNLYITFGDLLLIEALSLIEDNDGLPEAVYALLYYETAADFFAYAYNIKRNEPTEQFQQAKRDSENGFLVAQQGIRQALASFPGDLQNPAELVREKSDSAFKRLQELLVEVAPDTAIKEVSANKVGLDPGTHKQLAEIYRTLAQEEAEILFAACTIGNRRKLGDELKPETLREKVLGTYSDAAKNEILYHILTPSSKEINGEIFTTLQNLYLERQETGFPPISCFSN